MKDLYSIGDVAKYANINTSALRYYDEIGLVSPSFRNPETGYRYYSASDLWKLEIIQTIKKLGVPIEQIKDVITSNSSEKFYELLKLQREKAVENLKQLTALVDDLSSMIESFESIEEILPSPVVKKKINKRYALATDSGIADFDSDTLHFELRKKLDSSVMSNQIKKTQYGYALNKDSFINGEAEWEKEFLILDGTIDNKEILEIPEGEYLCFQCKPFSDIHNLKEFFNKLKEDYGEEHLGLIYAMVVVFHISDWQEEVFEIQIEYKS